MNKQHSPRGASRSVLFVCNLIALGLSHTSTVVADFDAPYGLTPPLVGGYVTPPVSTTFGAWTVTAASGDFWAVDTAPSSPYSLKLDVIDLDPVPSLASITFIATAPSAGTFALDYSAAYGFNSPIIEFLQNGSPVVTNPGPGIGSYTFTLGAADTFGFRLQATSDGVIASQASLSVTPEPHTALLAATGLMMLLGGRRRQA